MPITLTSTEIDAYRRHGYLTLHQQVLAPAAFGRLQAYCTELFAAAAQGGDGPALIDCPHWRDPRLFEWLFADELLRLVEPLIGPDIGLFACHLLQKPAGVGKRVPWHEDSAYWKTVLQPMEVASVTVALEPCLRTNGCLRVIPGTHRHGYSDYAPVDRPADNVFGFEIKPEQMDPSQAVDIELQPGEASLHHGRIIHGSNANTGTVRRAVLTARYFPTTVKFVPEAHEYFQRGFHIYLARGRDHAGNRYSDPARAYHKDDAISTV